jgi:hypothetical protein
LKIPKGFELEEGESAIGSWKAALPRGPESGIAEHEGRLVLTDRRLAFVPANWSKWTRRVALLDRSAGEQGIFRLDQIRSVGPGEGKIPRLRIEVTERDPVVLLISASGINVNPRRRRNWAELEDAVDSISARLR